MFIRDIQEVNLYVILICMTIYTEYIEYSNVKNNYIRGKYLERLEKRKK